MADLELLLRLVTRDSTTELAETRDEIEADATSGAFKKETVTLANGFNALSPPAGATLCVIEPLTGAVTWTLKGVTGDTGIALAAASTLPTKPTMVSLGTTPALGLTVTGAATALVYWY